MVKFIVVVVEEQQRWAASRETELATAHHLRSLSSSPFPSSTRKIEQFRHGRITDRAHRMAQRPPAAQLQQGRAVWHRRCLLPDHGLDLWSVPLRHLVFTLVEWLTELAVSRRCPNGEGEDERQA